MPRASCRPINGNRPFRATLALTAALALAGAQPAPALAQDYAAIVAAPDRLESDRVIDKRRKSAQLFAFARVKTGMKVLDMGAGGGYTTELLVRIVGPTGKVYAQDSPTPFPRAKESFDARMLKPLMKDVIRYARPYDDPVPSAEGEFDAITFFFYYHDVTYMQVNRAEMNKRMFAALKPGGLLVIADHSARAGEGTSVGKSLHRIEESALRAEIEAAGFKLIASGDFLRNPNDPRDKPVSNPQQPNDEFVLLFEKPR